MLSLQIHGILSPLSMVCRTPYQWHIEPLTHGIVIYYTWYLKPSLHGILNPLHMAYRTPYQKYCDPRLWCIKCHFDPLSMLF